MISSPFDATQKLMQRHAIESILFCADVALVGGSDLWNQRRAERADIVIRVNDNWRRQGGRIDALFSRQAPPVDLAAELQFCLYDMNADHAIEWQRFCLSRDCLFLGFDCNIYKKRNPRGPEYEWCNAFNKAIKTMPLTGVLAAIWLSRMPVNSVFLTGFDFYAQAGSAPAQRDSHAIDPQMFALEDLARFDARFRFDEPLKEIIKSVYPF